MKRLILAALLALTLLTMCAPGSVLHAEDEMPILYTDTFLPYLAR